MKTRFSSTEPAAPAGYVNAKFSEILEDGIRKIAVHVPIVGESSPVEGSPPSSGVSVFTDLGDVPASYSGQAGKTVTVKGDETGLEFTSPSGSPLVYLGQISLASTQQLTAVGDSTYKELQLRINDVKFSNDNVNFLMKVITGGGVQSTGYQWGNFRFTASASTGATGNSSDTSIQLADAIGNDTNESISGEIKLANPHAATYKRFRSQFQYTTFNPQMFGLVGGSIWQSTTAITGFEFSISAGTFSSGTVIIYGLKDS